MSRSRIKGLTAALASSISLFSMALFVCQAQANHADPAGHGRDASPIVKITTPPNNSSYSWNALLNYSVVVSWEGKSTEYQEIPSNEVLITTTYISDLPEMTGEPSPPAAPTPAGLLAIVRSGCIGCHQFKARSTGPSFAAIAERYPDSQATSDTLARYIREGSTGVWGQGTMPPHPEFTEEQSHAIAHWIMKDAANPNVNYYVGTEGAIRMEAPATPGSRAGIILTASYTAAVPTTGNEQAPHGDASVIVRGK
jgi:cytochrome c551/c552